MKKYTAEEMLMGSENDYDELSEDVIAFLNEEETEE